MSHRFLCQPTTAFPKSIQLPSGANHRVRPLQSSSQLFTNPYFLHSSAAAISRRVAWRVHGSLANVINLGCTDCGVSPPSACSEMPIV